MLTVDTFYLGPSSCNPSFIDVHGSSCEDYSRLNFCTSEGGYGIGWNVQIFGEFDNFSVNGETAFLCPECGCKGSNWTSDKIFIF